jgi:simple sugar transport system permease protein
MTGESRSARRGFTRIAREAWLVGALPLVSIVLALIVGGVIIIASELFLPNHTFDPFLPITSYLALLDGSLGQESAIVNTLVSSTPLLLAGLAVAIGFKAGLFNIGAQGQFLMGALGAVAVGVAVSDAPPIVAIPVALAGGMLAGAAWGFIPGFLKAISGAHEVVTTIMLNYVAGSVLAWAVTGPLAVPQSPSPVTYAVGNAAYPILIGRNGHLGILVAAAAVIVVWWLLYRTTLGFEIRTVGASPDAARYAGMRPRLLIMLTMSLAGLLAGTAGAGVILGINHQMNSTFATTVGFDSIAVALLARSNPLAVPFAALLFGGMRAGSGLMQIRAGIPVELIDVIQAMILLFLVAGPALQRVFRITAAHTDLGGPETVVPPVPGEALV